MEVTNTRIKQEEGVQLGFDDAIQSGEFIQFKPDVQRDLLLTNVRFEALPKDDKFNPEGIALFADVHEDCGKVCERVLKVTSNRLLEALRPHLEGVSGEIKLSILMIGEGFQTQYSVRVL